MADTRITQLGEISSITSDDLFVVVDGATTVTKKVQAGNMLPDSVVSTSKLVDGSISFVKLMATIFSGQVTSFTNTGTAGGTLYRLNLGGVKLMWGTSATQGFGAGAPPQTFSLTFVPPAGFFGSVQAVTTSWGPASATQYVYTSLSSVSATSIGVNVNEHAGTAGAGSIQIFAIGS